MEVYDKATWHTDGGENEEEVVERFRLVFDFLSKKNMLTDLGRETMEFFMGADISLNTRMVNEVGENFLNQYYDNILSEDNSRINECLIKYYNEFIEKN
ncbi:MAG: hypothetical protein K6G63_06670 [Eubacterium sp.]|nr:hypothetical protein [Eubacterium sp.]